MSKKVTDLSRRVDEIDKLLEEILADKLRGDWETIRSLQNLELDVSKLNKEVQIIRQHLLKQGVYNV